MTHGVAAEIGQMQGPVALPRDNGELVFAAPWQSRAFAMAVALVQRLGLDWDEFRRRLIEAISAQPGRTYYESWAAALEALVIDRGLAEPDDLRRRVGRER